MAFIPRGRGCTVLSDSLQPFKSPELHRWRNPIRPERPITGDDATKRRTLSETRGFLKALVEADGEHTVVLDRFRHRSRRDYVRRPDRDDRRAAVYEAA